MRWAFWRRRRPAASSEAVAASGPHSGPMVRTPSRDEQEEDRPPAPAFSGAQPDPVTALRDLDRRDPAEGPGELVDLDVRRTRRALLDLVRAGEEGDVAEARAAHRRVQDLGPDALDVAVLAARVALGVQLRIASGHGPDGAADAAAVQAAVAQGETVAGRAAGLLESLAPACRRADVKRLASLAAGVENRDVLLVEGDVSASDELMVLCVLLGRTLRDGGDVQDVEDAVGVLLGD